MRIKFITKLKNTMNTLLRDIKFIIQRLIMPKLSSEYKGKIHLIASKYKM